MSLSVRNAITDLRARLSRPLIWSFALGFPAVCMFTMVLFAPPGASVRVREVSWCLLAFIPMLIFSPIPWQVRPDRRRLNPWYWALPSHMLFSALLGPILTAVVILAITPMEGFRAGFLAHVGEGTLVFWGLTLPLGWMQAHATWLQEGTERARAQAEASSWMRHETSFDPDLLVSHLRHLAQAAEADPGRAVDGILTLAQLYRQWLIMSECPLVGLDEERCLLDLFAEAEGFRTHGDLRIEWFWAPGRVAWKLPPFCLFSLASLAVSMGMRHLCFRAETHAKGLRLAVGGRLPERIKEHAVWQGVSARLIQVLGPDHGVELDAEGQATFTLPGVVE